MFVGSPPSLTWLRLEIIEAREKYTGLIIRLAFLQKYCRSKMI